MSEPTFAYSQASRCTGCDGRAVIPTREIAEAFIERSEGRLVAYECPYDYGLHLMYPAVEGRSPASAR